MSRAGSRNKISKGSSAGSLSPCLLVATPRVQDPNFERTVLLLVEDGPDGSLAFVLNRPSPLSLKDVVDAIGIATLKPPAWTVRRGGPVAENVGWLVFDPRGCSSEELADAIVLGPDLAISASQELLASAATLQTPLRSATLMLGYAGWAPGQLEAEFLRGDWMRMDTDTEVILEMTASEIWSSCMMRSGVDPARFVASGSVFRA